jgi:TolB-like protein/cytochrome c-type biogenesis protein CcmH/NrfG
MGDDSPKPVSTSTGAVFLSYASQDAAVAQRICAALRAAGIDVWFDQSELRGGDAWDQSIRRQIKTCALFIPIISRHTHERAEGYFRLEWKLAVDRSHLIVANRAFLLPVVIDDTGNDDEHVPEKFREVQWTRLPNGETPGAFVDRVKRLLSGEASTAARAPALPGVQQGRASAWPRRALLIGVVLAGAVGYLAIERAWISPPAVAAAFAAPPHSIAVLPFVNMSGDKEQEYFSDGLTEEVLNSLAEIDGLQVAARTSAFSFKGKDTDIATIARKLNVGAVLEGSVRRSGNTVRVTTQLINAVTGFHLWSHTYDRDLGDVLKLETEIAGAVASALKVSLLGGAVTKIELGGTRNPAAFDAYLRARMLSRSAGGAADRQPAIAGFTEAIRLDPTFALAFAWRSLQYSNLDGEEAAAGMTRHEIRERQEADAREAIRLAPELAEGYGAVGRSASAALDFIRARAAFERALALAPGNASTLVMSSYFLGSMGQSDAAISAARRAVTLDPLNGNSPFALGMALYVARRYQEALAPYADAIRLADWPDIYAARGHAYYMLGDLENARSSCEHNPEYWLNQLCLAVVYDKVGRRADAQGELAKMKSTLGDGAAYQYAAIYAQWGDRAKALEWLATSMRLRDPGLEELKTDPLMDPLREEPRFQAIMRELNFPD